MKKLIKIILSVSMLFTCFGVDAVFAEEITATSPVYGNKTIQEIWEAYGQCGTVEVDISLTRGGNITNEIGLYAKGNSENAGDTFTATANNTDTILFADNLHVIIGDGADPNNIRLMNGSYYEEGDVKYIGNRTEAIGSSEIYWDEFPKDLEVNGNYQQGEIGLTFDRVVVNTGKLDINNYFETNELVIKSGASISINDHGFLAVNAKLNNSGTITGCNEHTLEIRENIEEVTGFIYFDGENTIDQYPINNECRQFVYDGEKWNISIPMPELALYKSNETNPDNLVENLAQYDDNQDFYLLPCLGDDWEIDSWSIWTFDGEGEQPTKKELTNDTDYTFDSNTKEFKFTKKPEREIIIKYRVKNILNANDYHDSETFIQNFSGGGDRKAHIEYDGNDITFGVANYSEDANLHITDVQNFNSSENDVTFKLYLAAGIIQGATAQAAAQAVYDGISNVTTEIENSSFDPGTITVSVGDSKENYCGVGMYPINVTVLANSSGSADIKISFNLYLNNETQNLITYASIDVRNESVYEFSVDDMSKFNSCFSSYDNFLQEANDVPEDVTKINIYLPKGEFSGEYIINFNDYNSKCGKELNIIGNMSDNSGSLVKDTTIKGTLIIEGGFIYVRDINFIANTSVKISDSNVGISDKTVGVIAHSSNDSACGAYSVNNCSFKDYDYAVCSTYTGIICDINDNYFDNCGHAYYMDCHNNHLNIGGDSSSNNIFKNCKYGVSIISTPEQLPAYSLRFKENYFYHTNDGDYADFYIRQNDGIFYFQKNYYGNTESGRSNVIASGDSKGLFNDLRTVKIDLGSCNSTVVTNPCIRYQDSQQNNVLGIDPADGLNFRIFSEPNPENQMQIDARDVVNIKNMGISGSDGQDDFGSFDFTKEAE